MRFIPTPGLEQKLALLPGMAKVGGAVAELGAQRARQLARREAFDEGDYMRGIEADQGEEGGRMIGRLVATDFKSHWIEFGSVNNTPKAILRRASEGVGRFTPTPRSQRG